LEKVGLIVSADVYLVAGLRTPFGKYAGALSGVRTDDLLVLVLKELMERTNLPGTAVDEVVTGCVNQSGEDNRNVARMVTLLAGLPKEVPAITVNRLCSSGLSALTYGARSIIAGDNELVLVSGVESMSRAPYVMAKPTRAFARPAPDVFDSAIGWRFTNPRFHDTYPPIEMGETAERVADQFKISRADQDEFAFNSHQKTSAAYEAGYYRDQLLNMSELSGDESHRSNIAIDSLAKIKPAFLSGGSVTAGNSSPLSDGAAALILASSKACERYGLKPIARYVASGNAGVDPAIMGIGPVPATQKALKRSGWGIVDSDHFEINEAFAAQVLAVQRELQIPLERLNQDGGAIAIGHPLGASGIRLALTAISRMARDSKAKRALLSACIGVGQGETILLESCL
jgi:acetyl-CoA acetyltransferase family protein